MIDKIENALLTIWIFALPLMLNKYFGYGSLLERIQLSDLVFLLIFVLFLIKAVRGEIKFDFAYLFFPLSLLLLSFLISSFGSADFDVSFSESLVLFYLVAVSLIAANLLKEKEKLFRALESWVFASSVVASLGIIGVLLSHFGINNTFARLYPTFLNAKYRLVSTMNLPNMAYGYFHISFFLSLGLLLNEKARIKKIAYLCAALILVTAIFLTFSRGWASLFFGAGFLVYFVKPKAAAWTKFFAVVLILTAFVIFVFVQVFITYAPGISFSLEHAPAGSRGNAAYVYKEEEHFLSSQRPHVRLVAAFLPGSYWYMRKAAVKLWQEHPFFGAGPGAYGSYIEKLDFPGYDPHSTYFGILAENGAFGLFALAVLCIYFMRKTISAFKAASDAGMKNLILCCAAAFVGLAIFAIDVDILNFRWLWFLLGLSAAAGKAQC